MTDEQRRKLIAASQINRVTYFIEKDEVKRHKVMGKVIDEVYIIVDDYKHMIQRIQSQEPYWDGSTVAYRTCYYTFDAKGENIKFGQYAQFLTQKEYSVLLAKARAKGWPIF